MKDLYTSENFKKIEFWGVTTIFVFVLFFHISHALGNDISIDRQSPVVPRQPFDYYFVSNLIRYVILYASFLLLNFLVIPKLLKKEAVLLQVTLIITTGLVIGLLLGLTNTSLKYRMLPNTYVNAATHQSIFQNSMLFACKLLLMFGFYSVIRYTGIYILTQREAIRQRYPFITPGGLLVLVLWMLLLFFLIIGEAEPVAIAMVGILVPLTIFFYWYLFYSLIPRSLPRKRPFLYFSLRVLMVQGLVYLPVLLLSVLIVPYLDNALAVPAFNLPFQLFITAPVCWMVFKRQMQGKEELFVLKKELGRSHANLDFLRSQINPHFLFNALNTIYGTALQEGAARTSEGVQRLGDMMRFMMQENLQEKIPLSREIEYLHNYIGLQLLRLENNPDIRVESRIDDGPHLHGIAPMLLIPFVENAFKHGISLRAPSHIKIMLEVKDGTLYFDVHNSRHPRPEHDPEKNRNGIGLDNVRQRLQLLYPSRHELLIRETGKEYFIHLTLQLS